MNLQSPSVSEETLKVPRRLVTLDFLRGVAIFGMTLFHILFKMYDVEGFMANQEEILNFPIILLIIMGVFAYFGSWYGFFLLISSVVNSYVFTRKTKANVDPSKLLIKQISSGAILIVLAYFIEGILGYYGDIGYSIKKLEWTNFAYFKVELLWIQTLQIIGLCLIINGLLLFFLLRNDGYKKVIRNISIFACLILLVLIFTPFISNWIANSNWLYPPEELGWPDITFVYHNRSVRTWFLTIINGPKQPLFPYLASSFMGSLIGMLLAAPKPPKRMLLLFSLVGVLMIASGVILIVEGLPFTFLEQPPAITTYLLRLGGQICLLMAMLALIESRGKGKAFSNRRIVKYFRRWSILSLTIYSLHVLELLPRWILSLILQKQPGYNFMEEGIIGRGQELWLFLAIIYVLLFYELVVRLFVRFRMKGSFEWLIVKFQNLFKGVKSTKIVSDLLGDEIEWIEYRNIREEIPIKEQVV
ncbi:MAG: hypothetical protein HGN29_11335 [Asgard group archaeon]|nr:hypothetical protein [Asgard group archaeon]